MKRLDPRSWAFAVVAILATAVFVRLGAWQLERLVERRVDNDERTVLASSPPVELPGAAADLPSDSLMWRRVRLTGTWDYDNEIVIRGRAALGSPGVHLVTPLRLEGNPAVLVLRGWLPAADGLSADLQSARPAPDDPERSSTVVVTGRVFPGEASSAIPPRFTRFEVGVHLVLGSLDLDAAQRDLEDPILDAWVLPDSSTYPAGGGVPRLVEASPPSDGPHLMYAIQWFGFAAITLAGAAVFLVGRQANRTEGDRA
jgi:surfeit locus 1 family protein